MWYYSKDNKNKIGPISDAAVSELFSDGKIDANTMMWSPQQHTWKKLDKSLIYKRLTSKKPSRHLESLRFSTYLFRSLLIVLLICFGYRISFLFDTLKIYNDYVNLPDAMQSMSLTLTIVENGMFAKLISYIILVLALFTGYAGFRWVLGVSKISAMISKKYTYGHYASAWSFVIPIINMILPPSVIWHNYKASIGSHKIFGIGKILLVSIWTIFWILSIIMFFVANYIIPQKCMPEQIESFYFAKIFISSIFFVCTLLTIIIVSNIFGLQRAELQSHNGGYSKRKSM